MYESFHKISQAFWDGYVHCKKMLAVKPSPAGMSLNRESLVSDISAGDGKTGNPFFTV